MDFTQVAVSGVIRSVKSYPSKNGSFTDLRITLERKLNKTETEETRVAASVKNEVAKIFRVGSNIVASGRLGKENVVEATSYGGLTLAGSIGERKSNTSGGSGGNSQEASSDSGW